MNREKVRTYDKNCLKYDDESFHFILIVLTIWLVDDPFRVLKEAVRALKKNGSLILGILDKKSSWGKFYEQKAAQSKFYKAGHFFSAAEILQIFKNVALEIKEALQTLLHAPPDIKDIEEPKRGFGQGGFVVIKGIKK